MKIKNTQDAKNHLIQQIEKLEKKFFEYKQEIGNYSKDELAKAHKTLSNDFNNITKRQFSIVVVSGFVEDIESLNETLQRVNELIFPGEHIPEGIALVSPAGFHPDTEIYLTA